MQKRAVSGKRKTKKTKAKTKDRYAVSSYRLAAGYCG